MQFPITYLFVEHSPQYLGVQKVLVILFKMSKCLDVQVSCNSVWNAEHIHWPYSLTKYARTYSTNTWWAMKLKASGKRFTIYNHAKYWTLWPRGYKYKPAVKTKPNKKAATKRRLTYVLLVQLRLLDHLLAFLFLATLLVWLTNQAAVSLHEVSMRQAERKSCFSNLHRLENTRVPALFETQNTKLYSHCPHEKRSSARDNAMNKMVLEHFLLILLKKNKGSVDIDTQQITVLVHCLENTRVPALFETQNKKLYSHCPHEKRSSARDNGINKMVLEHFLMILLQRKINMDSVDTIDT